MSNMQGMQLNTDFSGIKPNSPAGASFPVTTDKLGHLVRIVESGPRENSKKNGMLCVLKLEILDGPAKGFVGEHFINWTNANPQAAEIGQQELSAIAHVTGVIRVGNTVELHNKPFRILVRQQKENDKYTEIYGVLDVNGNEAGKAGQGPLQAGAGGGGFGGNPQGGQGGFGGGAPAGGFGPGPGAAQGGGFAPGPGQAGPQGGGQGNWQPNPGAGAQGPQGGGQAGWAAGGQQQNPQGGQQWGNQAGPQGGNPQGGGNPGWSGGGQAAGGQPGWAAGGQPGN